MTRPRERDLHGLTPAGWDALCIRCGECCRLADYSKDIPVMLDAYCPHLHFAGNVASCDIYEHKFGTSLPDGGVCSPIEDCTWRGPRCGYNKHLPPPVGIRQRFHQTRLAVKEGDM